MKLGKWIIAIIIMVCFLIMSILNILAKDLNNIKEEWPKYKCNPLVMPFAGYFGVETSTNFTDCIKDIQTTQMSSILKPFNVVLGSLGSVASSFGTSINSIRTMLSYIREKIMGLVKSIFGAIFVMLTEFSKIIMKIIDLIGKVLGMLVTLIYILDGSMQSMLSIWKGPPGGVIRTVSGFCFHENTKMKCNGGRFRKPDVKKINEINLGDRLEDGSIVYGTMKLKNKGETGYLSKMYKFPQMGIDGDDIVVSGSHLILDGNDEYIYVKDHSKSVEMMENYEELYCLITNTHNIVINGNKFGDWEDNGTLPDEIKYVEKKRKVI